MKKIKYIILLVVFPLSLFAQGGSVYSRYGIGDLLFLNSARELGLGSIGFATANSSFLSSLNPAAWHKIPLTRFEIGMYYSGNNISDNASSVMYSDFKFSGFTIGFPVERDLGITVVAGLLPYSKVGYEVTHEISNPAVEDDYEMTFSGKGGINKFFIGSSYTTPFDATIGLSFEYYTGKIEYTSQIDFPVGSYYKDAVYLNKHIYKGSGINLGIISNDFSEYLGLNKLDDLRIGINYNQIFNATADTTLYSSTTIGTQSLESGLMDVEIPSRLGVGLSFVWDENYLFLFDYIHLPFSQYQFGGGNLSYLDDYSRFSLGIEYKNHNVRHGTFWEQLTLRGGLSYEQSQYRLNNTDIEKMSLHAGISFPISAESSIDVGFEYGVKGTTDNNLLKENIYKAFVTINFGELWFIRRER